MIQLPQTTWYPNPPSQFATLRVGLFGGSFNPAHEGHVHIAMTALMALGLDEIWWMVSPQNPLKSSDTMAPLEKRMQSARLRASHPQMRVTDLETSLQTTYTAETLLSLRQMFPRHRFIWMMGADNLIQIPNWKDWSEIFHTVSVAVFARPTYSVRALTGVAAHRFARHRLPERDSRLLPTLDPPAWTFLHSKLHPASASAIREAYGDGASWADSTD